MKSKTVSGVIVTAAPVVIKTQIHDRDKRREKCGVKVKEEKAKTA